MVAESSERIHLMLYRRGEYILNRLRAQMAFNKVVSLTYRGVTYEKLLESTEIDVHPQLKGQSD